MVNEVSPSAPINQGTTLDSTLARAATQLPHSTEGAGTPATFTAPSAAARTTVLPKVDTDGTRLEFSLESRSRYEPTKLLGVGGMGEVVLVKDLDIERRVAVKRLAPEVSDPSILARFVDEIRTVGRLEHPNIVPIHDVGVDELGRYFFVMKYVEGETLEHIIEKLAAGDPAYVDKYSIEARVQLFLGILHALEYAHSQGIVHRDIKPANVMVGRYGEVVLMDWGIARPVNAARDAARTADATLGHDDERDRGRLYTTRVGTLIGTPAYMSPEQARGENDKIDARSDLYSAMVLFHELLGLRHYLAEKESIAELIPAIIEKNFGFFDYVFMKYPRGQTPPAEMIHIFTKGLQKDPAKRFQTAGELIERLNGVLEGEVMVQCQYTFTKRMYRELGRLTDRSPTLAFMVLLVLVSALVFSGVQLARMALA